MKNKRILSLYLIDQTKLLKVLYRYNIINLMISLISYFVYICQLIE
jgi:hypothetical protein